MRRAFSVILDAVELQGDVIIYSQTFNSRREKGVSPLVTHGCFYFLAYLESQRKRNIWIIVKYRDHFVKNGQLGWGWGAGRWGGVCPVAIPSA